MRAIETKTARSKLPVSKVPVFVRLGQGVSIGYRRNVGGAGVWVVRITDGKRGNIKKRLALADDLAPANGRTIMDYQQAAEAARREVFGGTEEGKQLSPSLPVCGIDGGMNLTQGFSLDQLAVHRQIVSRIFFETSLETNTFFFSIITSMDSS